MALYLVQHGVSYPKREDPEQRLTHDGRAEVERIAGVARGYGVAVGLIQHSGRPRARETAEILARHLEPRRGVAAREGLGPLDDVTLVAGQLNPTADLMLVGHLPFLEQLTANLITGQAERPVFRFQNGGIVCLDLHPDTGSWVVAWALQPHIG